MYEVKTYRGTWDEIVSHKDDLPPNAMLEIRVVSEPPLALGSPSLYDRFKDVIGSVEGLPEDLAQNPGKYMTGFGDQTSDKND